MKATTRVGSLAVAAALLGLTAASAALAQTAGMSTELTRASGKIAALDLKQRALKLEVTAEGAQAGTAAKPEPVTFILDEKTVITKDVKQLKAEELKVGDQVEIDYAAQDGKNMARSIAVEPAGAEAPAAEPSPERRSPTKEPVRQ